jgi:adenine-specific DNA-methyltransferase
MSSVDVLEETRLALQASLDAAKHQGERNRMGQFATVSALASEVVAHAISLLPQRSGIRFLDPAFGTGSFFSALLRAVPASRVACACAYEVDEHYGEGAVRLWRGEPIKIHVSDFTRQSPPPSDASKANLIVCNPPYVRHHHIGAQEKLRLRDAAERASGVRLSGLAGLYCYFLCLSHEWMCEGGAAAWLIPSEWMDVNYGEEVKKYLLERVTLERVHRFDPQAVQFEDALVSSAVVFFRKSPPPAGHRVLFTYGGSLENPSVSSRVPCDELRGASKWTRFPRATGATAAAEPRATLSDMFRIKRGLATGANEFFILTADKVEEHHIPKEFLTPILPSPRYLPVDEVASDPDGTPQLDCKLFLLTCKLPEGEVRANHPAVWEYLQTGMRTGLGERYLVKHRTPWYLQEDRPPAPLLCTYMGRHEGKRRSPFRFILNHSKATAANVYLMLYPTPALSAEIKKNPDLLRSIWEILNQIPAETVIGEGRVYGGGLHKLEPRELGKVPAEELLRLLPKAEAANVEQTLLFER